MPNSSRRISSMTTRRPRRMERKFFSLSGQRTRTDMYCSHPCANEQSTHPLLRPASSLHCKNLRAQQMFIARHRTPDHESQHTLRCLSGKPAIPRKSTEVKARIAASKPENTLISQGRHILCNVHIVLVLGCNSGD